MAPVNDAPVDADESATVTEDVTLSVPAAAGLLANFTDADGPAAAVTSFLVAGNPTPFAVTPGTPGVATIAGVGVLTINSDGSYSFAPALDYAGAIPVVTYTVNDGSGSPTATDTSTLTLAMAPVNDAPVAADDVASTPVNTPIASIVVLGNDTDPEGNPLTVTGATLNNPALGTVSVNLDGTLAFTPALNVNGPVVITYSISDGQGGTATATLTINVGANTPPTGTDATRTVLEDTSYPLAVADFGFADADAGQTLLAVRIDSLPAAGVLSLNGTPVTAGQQIALSDLSAGALVFTPALNGNGPAYASFTFSVQDSAGSFDVAPNTVTINITPVNDAPVALDDTLVPIAEDTPLTISPATLLGNDSDPDADPLTITSVQAPVGGTVALVGGSVVFTPTPNYNGPASFTYTISDGNGGTSTATVNVTVSPVNDAPIAANDVASTPVNTPIASIDVLGNDSDPDGNPLSVTGATLNNPAQGTVTVNPDGTLNFTPALNVSGPVVITYSISDGQGGTATATLTINVGANTPPTGTDATRTVLEDTSYPLAVADFGFADADAGQTLLAVRIDSLPAAGVLSLNGTPVTAGQQIALSDLSAGALVFTPALNGNGPAYASFTFSVQDSAGSFDVAPNTVTINITPVNDAPVALDDTLVPIAEDTPLTISPATLLGNDSDPDADPLTITSVQAPVGGTVALVGGSVVFTPTPNYNGPASFTYTISDGNGGTSTATVNVTVAPTDPQAPQIYVYPDAPRFYVPPAIIGTDPALHVLYSVNDVRVDTGLRAGLGIFQTDSATLAELSSEQALLLDTLTAPRGLDGLDDSHLRGNGIGAVNALFVQHAVRHEATGFRGWPFCPKLSSFITTRVTGPQYPG